MNEAFLLLALALGISLVARSAFAAVPPVRFVPLPERRTNTLDPRFAEKVRLFVADAAAKGIPLTITETRRSTARQEALYAQGRSEPGTVVTQTKESRHIYGLAVDVWPTGVSFSDPKARDILTRAAQIAREHGLENLSSIGDYGHFQESADA